MSFSSIFNSFSDQRIERYGKKDDRNGDNGLKCLIFSFGLLLPHKKDILHNKIENGKEEVLDLRENPFEAIDYAIFAPTD